MICHENIVDITLLYLDKSCLFNNNYAYKYIFFSSIFIFGKFGCSFEHPKIKGNAMC